MFEVIPVCWLVPVEEAVEVVVDVAADEDEVVIKQSPILLSNV